MNKRQINISLDRVQRVIDDDPNQLLSYADVKMASKNHLRELKNTEIAEVKTLTYAAT